MVCSTETPVVMGEMLSGELFGGVLVIVVIATNVVSIAITYIITKKRIEVMRRQRDSVENAETIRNNCALPIYTEARTKRQENAGLSNQDMELNVSFSRSGTGNGINKDSLYDIPEGSEVSNNMDSATNRVNDAYNQSNLYDDTQSGITSDPKSSRSYENQNPGNFNRFSHVKTTSLPIPSSTFNERHRNYLIPSCSENFYDQKLQSFDEEEYEDWEINTSASNRAQPYKKNIS